MKQSKDYQEACRLPKNNQQRSQAFYNLNKRFGFTEYCIHAYSAQFNRCWINNHLDICTIQKLATRAFLAIQKVAFGIAKNVRFKGKNQIDSVEGKSNASGIRFRKGFVCWKGMKIEAIVDLSDPVVAHGLQHRIKYYRIVKRKFNGKIRFFVQLVLEGIPFQKRLSSTNQVGLDIGPSTISHVSENHAQLETFCSELKIKQKEIRKLQRKLDRSRRSTNPNNYNDDSTVKKGKQKWIFSVRYRKTKTKLEEIQRKQKAERKSLHGNLANRILLKGKHVKTEKISIKAFQKMFGKSVQFRAPGLFVSLLRRKAESAGGKVEEFSTRDTRLSQYCHVCGRCQKKPLSQRWHTCCGIHVQRDLYSAYLALHVQGNSLDTTAVQKQWSSMESMLVQAVSKNMQNMQAASEKPCFPALA